MKDSTTEVVLEFMRDWKEDNNARLDDISERLTQLENHHHYERGRKSFAGGLRGGVFQIALVLLGAALAGFGGAKLEAVTGGHPPVAYLPPPKTTTPYLPPDILPGEEDDDEA